MADIELRSFALRVVEAETLAVKLASPGGRLIDDDPGESLRLVQPGRPPGLQIRPSREVKVPALEGMIDPRQRVRILHAFANHELQAVELFAWAVLAFPDAPADFRLGLGRLILEEQAHCRLYQRRLAALSVRLGDFPVNGYFWSKVPTLTTPLRFVCALGLTFENANLDHTVEYAAAARAAGDEETARLLDQIREDEARHVAFGYRWLVHWKPAGRSPWETYADNVTYPLRGALARGTTFHPGGRRSAGLDEEFIDQLSRSDRGDPSRREEP